MRELYLTLNDKIKVRIKLIFVISILSVILESLSILSVFPIIKSLFDPNFLKIKIPFIEPFVGEYNIILILCFAVFILFCFKNIFLFYFSILQSKFINYATVDLTANFFRNYLELKYVEFIKHNSSYYIRNVIENITAFFGVYFKCLVTLFVEGFLVLSLFVLTSPPISIKYIFY